MYYMNNLNIQHIVYENFQFAQEAKCSVLNTYNNSDLLASNSIKCSGLILDIDIQVCPELDKEEGILRALIIEFFQTTLLLRELVVDLPNIYCLK